MRQGWNGATVYIDRMEFAVDFGKNEDGALVMKDNPYYQPWKSLCVFPRLGVKHGGHVVTCALTPHSPARSGQPWRKGPEKLRMQSTLRNTNRGNISTTCGLTRSNRPDKNADFFCQVASTI